MVLVAGSANLDFVVRAPHIPGPGETVLGRRFTTYPGGKGANQAVASARAGGVSTHMLLALGKDAYAEPLKQSLQSAHVTLHTVEVADQPTGCAFICVSDDAENAITVAPGANLSLTDQHLPALAGFSHLLMQLETPLPTVTAYALKAKAQGITVVLNAAPAQQLPAELLKAVDVLIVNEGELAAIAGPHGSIVQAMAAIQVPTVIVTLGHLGCCARHQGQHLVQTAFAIDAVDTTGAGDTFCGTVVAALRQKNDLPHALRQASAASALACTRMGAQSSVPSALETTTFLAAQPAPTREQTAALHHYCGLA